MSSALERAQAYLRGEKPAQKSTAKSSAPGRGGGSERLSLSKSSVGGSRDVDESDDELQKYLEGLTKRKAASAGSGIPTSSPKASPYLKPGKSQDAKKPDVIKQASYLKSPKPAIDAKLDKNLVDTSSDDEPPRAGIKINANTTESEKTRDAKKGPLSLSADRVMNPPSAALDASKATAKSWGSFKKANKFGDLESDSSSDIDDLSQSIPKYKGNAASLLKKTASQVKSTTAIDNNSTTSSSPATSLNPQLSLVATQKEKKKAFLRTVIVASGSDFENTLAERRRHVQLPRL
ncbi:hypothetical protein BC829DRAFT_116927 [Chytridium lagenaria]|nr:hypothetical protein BC829DRAFT_116927 [Chytridium lagenaria]